MKFINNLPHDVYVDLGGLKRVVPGEVLDLPGVFSMNPLTPIMEAAPPKKKAKTKPKKTSTSGTI
jgi:hypothetical protein